MKKQILDEANATGGKLGTIISREARARAAYKEMQSRRREQEKADRQRLGELIGAAILADLESTGRDSRDAQRAYVCDVLDRYINTESSRAFIRSKGMLPMNAQKLKGHTSPDREDGSGSHRT